MNVQEISEKRKRYQPWQMKSPPYQCGRDGFSIVKVKRDEDGWADVKIFLPVSYEMVQLYVEGKKPFNGWWNGYGWEGFHLTSLS